MSFEYLTVQDVATIHADQIARYGGASEIRDQGMLESAVMSVQATFDGQRLHADLGSAAAAYLVHLALNHPFLDGNKRTAFAAALVFLDMNGVGISMSVNRQEALVLSVARGEIGVAEVEAILTAVMQ